MSRNDREIWNTHTTDALIASQTYYRGRLEHVEADDDDKQKLYRVDLKIICSALVSIGEILQERQAQD